MVLLVLYCVMLRGVSNIFSTIINRNGVDKILRERKKKVIIITRAA